MLEWAVELDNTAILTWLDQLPAIFPGDWGRVYTRIDKKNLRSSQHVDFSD